MLRGILQCLSKILFCSRYFKARKKVDEEKTLRFSFHFFHFEQRKNENNFVNLKNSFIKTIYSMKKQYFDNVNHDVE